MKLLIGMKFCGGCNPKYDRREVYNSIVEYFEECNDYWKSQKISVELVTKLIEYGDEVDYAILIGGCTNCCTSEDGYIVKKRTYKMRSADDKNQILSNILENLNGLEKIL